MVFSSLIFLYIFLPVVLALYFIMPNLKAKNITLLIASIIFYAWGEPGWIFLLIFMAAANYYLSRRINKYRGEAKGKRAMIFAVVLDLFLLGLFKYTGFLVENINFVTGLAIPAPAFGLPLGISFYTFQILSYVLDVYRGDVQVSRKLTDFMLYVALFPQLVAGPIVRYIDVEREINDRKTTFPMFVQGSTRFLVGLGKKVLLANTLGGVASTILDGNLADMSVFGAWAGILCFALQIYFDFSGYSDMAIGMGKMFGFHYLENFNFPYISKSITEFWRRWHMSLSSFFRDYLYIPLGGNRKRPYLNLLIVWFLTGMWHGANWNFILWGLYFFVFLLIEKLFLRKVLDKLPGWISHVYALFVIMLGWVFFYFTDLSLCFSVLGIMFGFGGKPGVDQQSLLLLRANLPLILFAIAASMPLSKYAKQVLWPLMQKRGYGKKAALALHFAFYMAMLFLCTSSLVGSSFNPFIYFRF